MFICKRCNAECTTNGNLKKHLQRKKPCHASFDSIDQSVYLQELNTIRSEDTFNKKCVYCEKGFKSSKTMYRHQIICKKNPKVSKLEIMINENIDELKSEIIRLRETLKDKDIQINSMGKELQHKKLSRAKQPPNNNLITQTNITQNITNHTINNNNNINIILRNFGDENLECLSGDICIGSYMFNDIITLIREMNFHPDFPENHNLDFTEDIIRKYLNGKWINSSWNKGVMDLIMAKIKVIEKLPDIIKEKKLDVQEYLTRNEWTQENYEEAPSERKDLIEDVKAKGRAFTQVEDYLLANIGKEKQIEVTIKEKANDKTSRMIF